MITTEPKILLNWYSQNARDLPWRKSRDPYSIWLSEVMLQQTTSTAVIPFYDNFLKKFKTIHELAKASIEDVYVLWSGLGYYSRARNLHKAAQQISENGFPDNHKALMELPGFGPYTARAVASFAFNEPVGVLDGNVIRFLSRYHKLKTEWWKPAGRAALQEYADVWAKKNSHDINQALIEIGATICTPKPHCASCPLLKSCKSAGTRDLELLPLKKPKKEMEIWVWEVQALRKNGKYAFLLNKDGENLPVLKNVLIWPGIAYKVKKQPEEFAFQHTVTHHKIYIKVSSRSKALKIPKVSGIKWLTQEELRKQNPASLVQKTFSFL